MKFKKDPLIDWGFIIYNDKGERLGHFSAYSIYIKSDTYIDLPNLSYICNQMIEQREKEQEN